MSAAVICFTKTETERKGSRRCKLLDDINQEMDNPLNNDSYYGKVDCLLTEMEELVTNFNKTK